MINENSDVVELVPPDPGKVYAILQQRFPLELEIATLTAKIGELVTAAEADSKIEDPKIEGDKSE